MKRRQIDVLNGPIAQTLLQLMVPILICGLFQQMYNLCDGIVAGQFAGSTGIAVIGGSAYTVINLFNSTSGGLTAGCMFIAAYFYGRQDSDGIRSSVETTLVLSFLYGAGALILNWTACRAYFELMQMPEVLMERSVRYLRLYSVGFIPNCIFLNVIGLMRSAGETRKPTVCLIVSYLLNIGADLLFTGVFHMQELGIAAAYVLSQTLSVCWTLYQFSAGSDLSLLHLSVSRDSLNRILKIAIPAILTSSFYQITNMMIAYAVNLLGANTIAAASIYNKIEYIYWIFMTGVSLSVTTFCGQNYGAGKYSRMKRGILYSLGISFLITGGISLLVLSGRNILPLMFTQDATVTALVTRMILILAPFYFTYTAIETLSAALRAVGKSTQTAVIAMIFISGVRVLYMLLYVLDHLSVESVFAAYPISWAAASIAYLIYYACIQKKIPADSTGK